MLKQTIIHSVIKKIT